MKIEKLSENQIRCTLSKEDLTERQLRISELAYGTEKAKALFQDMMQEASLIGFEAEDIPLMIEAIPVSADSLVLIVTKVEDPDELDTRFSRFTDIYDDEDMDDDEDAYGEYGQTGQMYEDIEGTLSFLEEEGKGDSEEKEKKIPKDYTCLFQFPSLEHVIRLSKQLVSEYDGWNTVYKDGAAGRYYLLLQKCDYAPEQFNKFCNIASEYGTAKRYSPSVGAYFKEHYQVIVSQEALQKLSRL